MAISLARPTAQKIVDTVKDVCGYDINFINTSGIIFASTDSSRIGDFHEVGKKVIETNETIEVVTDDGFFGTHKGVNIPFSYNRQVIAAIGITGDPNEVRKYAVLAQKITSLILREQEIDLMDHNQKNWQNYVIRSLISGSGLSFEQLSDFLQNAGLGVDDEYRTVLVRLSDRYNPSNLSMIESHIYHIFDTIEAKLYTFRFPNEYVLIISEAEYQKWNYVFPKLAENYLHLLSVGVGNRCGIFKQSDSYRNAEVAIKSLGSEVNFAVYDELELEILLGCVTETAKEKYQKKTIEKLGKEELDLLKIYFEQNMSLKDTAEKMFLHKNTLQYQLNRIEKITGYNPRSFQDAVKLFLATKV